METMTEFLQNLHSQGGKVGAVLKRFNTVLRMSQASAGNATAACLSAAACAGYQCKLSKDNFMELAGHIYDAEKGPRVPNKGLAPLTEKLPPPPTPAPLCAHPGESYHDDHGFVLWWRFPINEPPWVGTPNCEDWPGYHTHWTPLPPAPTEPDATRTP